MGFKKNDGKTIIPTPIWVLVIRAFQIVFSLILVGIDGWWIGQAYFDPFGFALFCGLITWIIAVYAVVTERVTACQKFYNTWAILALDALMILFWLAAMGAVAATRGDFKPDPVFKRAVRATSGALGLLSGVAALAAFNMLLFAASFGFLCHKFRRVVFPKNEAEKDGGTATSAPFIPPSTGAIELNSNVQSAGQQQQQYPQGHQDGHEKRAAYNEQAIHVQQTGYPQHAQYPPQTGLPPSTGYPQQTSFQTPVHQVTTQGTGYSGAAGV